MATVQKASTRTDARPSVAAKPASVEGPSPEQIKKRAYEIWQASGRPNGRDRDHWFQAERELRAGPQAQRG